jgi:CRP-like cAMP-binding protein
VSQYGIPVAAKFNPVGMERFSISKVEIMSLDHPRFAVSAQPQRANKPFTSVRLPLTMSLYRAGEVPQFAYFLTEGMASIVVSTADGQTAEVGIVGREGIIGALHVIGPAPLSTDCMMQIEGEGLQIAMQDFKTTFRSSEEFHERILEFAQEQALSLSQITGCNRLHEAEPRLARWLLMTQDRVQSDVLNFTQEFLPTCSGCRGRP